MLLAGTLLYVSCEEPGISGQLSSIESYIDTRPDSALVAIRQIDTTALRRRSTTAKYSLLHAIALDKNYIDTADTRVVRPAVDWYSRHGNPEEKLKAWMYLGTEQYNCEQYNKAIISFYRAIESLAGVKDNNLIGLLYSKVANTYTKTMDYAQASSFIEKSLDSFHSCGRKDQESLMLLHKASNLLQRRLWEEARNCYHDILSRNPMDPRIKRIAAMDYAVLLLTQPQPDEDLALSLMDNALKEGATFGSTSHLYAYIYLLKSRGRDKESEVYEKLASQEYEKDTYSSTYWKYRQELKSGNKDNAYRSLWTAMNVMDSIRMSSYELSAANAQRAYIEQTEAERILRAQDQRRKNIITS